MARNEEINRLIEEAEYNVRLADFLANEGHYKIAITRAYYSMYYVATALHLSNGRVYKSHKATISGFAEHFTKTGRFPNEFHTYLVRAFEMRSKADYDVNYDSDEPKARQVISWAEEFVQNGKEYLTEKPDNR